MRKRTEKQQKLKEKKEEKHLTKTSNISSA